MGHGPEMAADAAIGAAQRLQQHRQLFLRRFAAGRDVLMLAGASSGVTPAQDTALARDALGEARSLVLAIREPDTADAMDGPVTLRAGRPDLLPAEMASVDLVACFAPADWMVPAEGVAAPLFAEVHRVLRPGGLFVLAAADTDAARLRSRLGARFAHVALAEQRIGLDGLILPLDAPTAERDIAVSIDGRFHATRGGAYGQAALLALASDAPLPPVPLHLMDATAQRLTERAALEEAQAELARLREENGALRTCCALRDIQLDALRQRVDRLQQA